MKKADFANFVHDVNMLCDIYGVKMIINQNEQIEIIDDEYEKKIFNDVVFVDKTKL